MLMDARSAGGRSEAAVNVGTGHAMGKRIIILPPIRKSALGECASFLRFVIKRVALLFAIKNPCDLNAWHDLKRSLLLLICGVRLQISSNIFVRHVAL